MLRYHLQLHIPELSAGSVGGEEDNVVTDGKGEKVVLVIGPTQQDTVDRLSQALDGKVGVAELLAAIVHDPATYGSYHELESIGDTYDPDDVGKSIHAGPFKSSFLSSEFPIFQSSKINH